MSDIRFVLAAYGLTWTVLAGYWLRLRAIRRRAERELQEAGLRHGGAS